MGQVFDFGLRGIDLNKIVGNAMQLPQAISLAQEGRVDEAAAIYSQITGMEHNDALAAVKAMAAGHAVSLTPGQPGADWRQAQPSFAQSQSSVSVSSASYAGQANKSSSAGRGCGALAAIIAGVAVVIIGLVAAALYMFKGGPVTASLVPLGFAKQSLSFGGDGIGAGMFQDPRSIGVDRERQHNRG